MEFYAWIWWFNLLLAVMLTLDLGVFNRTPHKVSAREAAIWTCVWVGLAVCFNAGVYYWMGVERGLEWTTGYLIEKALSVDNVFVFALLMTAFRVPAENQHRLLFMGVVGALIMRLSIILAGSYLLEHFHWTFYIFGAFLIITGVRMFGTEEELHPERQPMLLWIRKRVPVTAAFVGAKFFVRQDGQLKATPMFLALIAIELSDLIFAIDSIPAIFAITANPFVVYTSNAFAILGLRSLYFLLAHAMTQFHYLKHGLGIVLAFVGIKMLVADYFKVPILWSLGIIVAVIVGAIIYSLRHPLPRSSEKPDRSLAKPRAR
jgi:tellurite resistance protein TerC